MKFLDLAIEILSGADKPFTYQEIWEAGREQGLDKKINTTGKTPGRTLGARLFVEVRDNPDSKFIKIGNRPARFFLRSKEGQIPENIIEKIGISEQKEKEPKSKYSEKICIPW